MFVFLIGNWKTTECLISFSVSVSFSQSSRTFGFGGKIAKHLEPIETVVRSLKRSIVY